MISMWKMREMVDKATNLVMNYTETEAKVREATNDDPWGPSGAQMQEIASFTFTYEQFPEVMGMLWKRMLQDNRQNWRRTYKSLLLLDYLIKNGSERVVTNAREHIYDLRSMENYAFVDDNGEKNESSDLSTVWKFENIFSHSEFYVKSNLVSQKTLKTVIVTFLQALNH